MSQPFDNREQVREYYKFLNQALKWEESQELSAEEAILERWLRMAFSCGWTAGRLSKKEIAQQ